MTIDVYADGADYNGIIEASKNKNIKGFTTNPTLMKAAGVTDFAKFSKDIIKELKQLRPDTNISLEVFADEQDEMIRQARVIDGWSKEYDYKVYVKIPVMNTKGVDNNEVVRTLVNDGINVNVTAIFTKEQTLGVLNAIKNLNSIKNLSTSVIISLFAGRIADTLRDPETIVRECVGLTSRESIKFLWASCREVFNYTQAERVGCDIITMTPDQIKKLDLCGKDLTEYSRETVQMFYNDAQKSGFVL
jgi:transaldolase